MQAQRSAEPVCGPDTAAGEVVGSMAQRHTSEQCVRFLKDIVADHDEDHDAVLVTVSLRNEPGDVPKGGLWIMEAPSKSAVLDLMQSDPFYTCGLRKDVEVLHWSKAFEDKVLV